MKSVLLIILIIAETLFAIYLVKTIRNNINNKEIVIPLARKQINIGKTSNLKYFYEPEADLISTESADFLTSTITYTINSDTLNERYNYDVNKSDSVYRIITIGDSFTYGMWVNTYENWPERLENILNRNIKICQKYKKVEIINLGVSGYDIAFSVNRFILRGKKYYPDLVIFLLKEDDFLEINEILHPIFNHYWNLYKAQNVLDDKLVNGDYSKVATYARETLKEKMSEKEIILYQKKHLKYLISNINSNLLFVSFSSLIDEYKNIINALISKDSKLYYHDSLTDVKALSEVLADGFHPTSKGHKLISDDIYKYIISNQIIPCH